MTNGRAFSCALGAGLLSLATLSDATPVNAELLLADLLEKPAAHDEMRATAAVSDGALPIVVNPGTHYGRRAYGGAVIQLHTTALQPLASSFAFGVSHVSFKNRQLFVMGDLVTLSALTYGALQLLFTTEHGARHRIRVGRIAPGRSQRVQVRLTTRCDRQPVSVRVSFVQAIADYQPMPRKTERPGRFEFKYDSPYAQPVSLDLSR